MARKKQGAKSPKKYASKSRSRRSRRSRSSRSIMGPSPRAMLSNPRGLPDRQILRLCYSDLQDTMTTAVPGYYQSARFSMTDISDPDITGTGLQPPLFDNYKALYSKWRVLSCKITCDVENYTNYPCYVTLVGLYDPTSNSPTSPANSATYDLLGLSTNVRSARKRVGTVQIGNSNVQTVSKTFRPQDLMGPNYLTAPTFSGGVNPPTNYAVVDLIAQVASAGAGAYVGLWLSWRAEYVVEFYDAIDTEIAAYD